MIFEFVLQRVQLTNFDFCFVASLFSSRQTEHANFEFCFPTGNAEHANFEFCFPIEKTEHPKIEFCFPVEKLNTQISSFLFSNLKVWKFCSKAKTKLTNFKVFVAAN